jgi:hypothetical protein
VDRIPENGTPPQERLAIPLRPEGIFAAARIEFTGDEIRFWIEAAVNRFLKSIAVLVCPVQLEVDAV